MDELLHFLEIYEFWIYLLLGAVGGIYLRKLFLAWQEWRTAIFGLERESALRRISRTMTVVILLGLIILAEFALVSFVVPGYPRENLLATPTLDLLATPTFALETAALYSETQVGVIETLAIGSSEGCIPGEIEWTHPGPGEELSGLVELKGTVNLLNLGFFKYEYSLSGSDNWVTIAAGSQEKIDELLGGVWNTAQLVPGDYLLRLVVTDNQNKLLTPCVIPVRVISP